MFILFNVEAYLLRRTYTSITLSMQRIYATQFSTLKYKYGLADGKDQVSFSTVKNRVEWAVFNRNGTRQRGVRSLVRLWEKQIHRRCGRS